MEGPLARLSRWTIFMRVFLVTLIVGQPARVGGQTSGEDQAWQRAQSDNTVQAYYGFLGEYPSGRYMQDAIRALRRLGALQEAQPGRQIPSLDGGTTSSARNTGGASAGTRPAESRPATAPQTDLY
jgi:hypothetical protein